MLFSDIESKVSFLARSGLGGSDLVHNATAFTPCLIDDTSLKLLDLRS